MHRRVVLWDWELMHFQAYVFIIYVYRAVYVDHYEHSLKSVKPFESRILIVWQCAASCDIVSLPKSVVVLCFSQNIEVALRNDPAAADFLNYLTRCYGYQNQSYYRYVLLSCCWCCC